VAEVVLSIDAGQSDPLGVVLQALLIDVANHEIVFDPGYRFAGFGLSEAGGSTYVLGLLAEDGP
jgi:hypothetical protein